MYPIRQYKQELEKIIKFGGSIRELFNGYKFADYKAQVLDLLRVCAGTMAVVREMGNDFQIN